MISSFSTTRKYRYLLDFTGILSINAQTAGTKTYIFLNKSTKLPCFVIISLRLGYEAYDRLLVSAPHLYSINDPPW